MTDAYIGEIRMFTGDFAPRGWALCNGQMLPTAQNQFLFSLLGTTYGGNGTTTFALPDLRGKAPLGVGAGTTLTNRTLGATGGAEKVALGVSHIPIHTHTPVATDSAANMTSPENARWASTGEGRSGPLAYSNAAPTTAMSPVTVEMTGNPSGPGEAHNNMPPYSTVNYIIALTGVYPQRP